MYHSNSSPKKLKCKNQFKLKLKYHLVHPNSKILLQNKFYTQEINHHSVTRQGEWSCVISNCEMLLKFPHPLYNHKAYLTSRKNLSTLRSINIMVHTGKESNYYCPSFLSVTAVHCPFFFNLYKTCSNSIMTFIKIFKWWLNLGTLLQQWSIQPYSVGGCLLIWGISAFLFTVLFLTWKDSHTAWLFIFSLKKKNLDK